MKTKILALSLGTAALLSLSPAFAAISAASGWYLEGTLGSTKQEDFSLGNNTSVKSVGAAGSASIGYKFMPFVATEIGYTQYGVQRISSGSTVVAKNRPFAYDIAVKGMIPIANSGFEPFAKLGVARLKTKIQTVSNPVASFNGGNASSTGLYIGAGAQYYFMPELAVVAEWARAKGNSSSTGTMDLYSIGLSFIID